MAAVGARFVADVDVVAWRRRVVPWGAAGVGVVVVGVLLAVFGVPVGVVVAVVAVGLVVPVAKVAGFVAQRRRRETPLMVDAEGVWVPTAQGPAFLPWETVREVVVDGPTVRFRVRAGVTPQTEGVRGMHRRDVWPVASGPGLPVDSRLYRRDVGEIRAAVREYSGGRL
ncbi:hypothetical protein [Actinokineospora sp. UTMC 2448]|uniref:hypothetical protein n=1 Tax=Actinokineospora sp. UTMC 2448 TaxID=2268449 RepID=UPI0021642868|nr:hypothetical protein [Actinokineospora sp. UTMC 2448]UVS79402.1 hypothetical protein Actkin_03149 [Actinokineospora sp. UTMC 2448]